MDGPHTAAPMTPDEHEAVAAARARAAGIDGLPGPSTCALVTWAATTVSARHAVEVGTSAGLTGISLLLGMEDRAVLTAIEPDTHLHGLATSAYERAGASEQVRAILGDPGEVLERLSDGGYELVLLSLPRPAFLAHARRLLRPGGMLVVLRAATAAARELRAQIAEDEDLASVLLPLDEGVLLATVR